MTRVEVKPRPEHARVPYTLVRNSRMFQFKYFCINVVTCGSVNRGTHVDSLHAEVYSVTTSTRVGYVNASGQYDPVFRLGCCFGNNITSLIGPGFNKS